MLTFVLCGSAALLNIHTPLALAHASHTHNQNYTTRHNITRHITLDNLPIYTFHTHVRTI